MFWGDIIQELERIFRIHTQIFHRIFQL
ncbi:hypothetical protein MXB_1377 [Myxobolus squamalis]|nr:hypothetical protein MXB_1377 [Myxobolus squamalis]